MSNDAPIVIIGTGLSGYSLAREIRKQDKEVPVLMLTADDGHSYSKPMLSTGFTKGKTADELAQSDAAGMAAQLNIELRTHTTVTGIDAEAHCVLIGDERLEYSKLVLAWGADVIRLQLKGEGQSFVHSINDLMDYRAFRQALEGKQRVAIMGAGLIGCEFANDLRNGGYEVDIIAPSDNVMPGLLPPVAGQAVIDALKDEGVRFHLETVVDHIEPNGDGVRLTLANGEIVEADRVISAVGLRPRTQLAESAGLDVQRGIVVDRHLQTSAEDIYALGDCAEVDGHVLLYVLPLMACSRALAKTLLGQATEVAYGVMPVMIKTPCCPTSVCPPPVGAEGDWEVEQNGRSVKAIFRDADGQALGFAVTGDFALEKQALSKEVPPLHR
ncbi:MAG: FAD-dependent oxidoreductase [Alteromonadaceae bacterium]|uniref:FAD-dependent oxidoreductase n=1 Tax=unclassified Marinobacter TaxID=83889 RepID=UPI000C36966C|nr:FAD-dependent oxidoreductase [Marinobacter sp. BGYM27]MAA66843.1 FAD-dependent oxidoreductase [Alteromonadaceae bacterium]MBH84914.1 FAD-dependent oxidoreductase [Alteromonadaceae bacterium]MDG5501025.1 FAD-dependent oxidoreductase [Marinobacter sp. BGYM27]|tara:strand:- start:1454 stop:2608 length:1155 start_codon:yes stop_codon:yes gene_type:complete